MTAGIQFKTKLKLLQDKVIQRLICISTKATWRVWITSPHSFQKPQHPALITPAERQKLANYLCVMAASKLLDQLFLLRCNCKGLSSCVWHKAGLGRLTTDQKHKQDYRSLTFHRTHKRQQNPAKRTVGQETPKKVGSLSAAFNTSLGDTELIRNCGTKQSLLSIPINNGQFISRGCIAHRITKRRGQGIGKEKLQAQV